MLSIIIVLIIALIGGYIVAMLLPDTWKPLAKATATVVIVIAIGFVYNYFMTKAHPEMSITNIIFGNTKKDAGWQYLKDNIKCPAETKLIEYQEKTKLDEPLSDIPGLTTAIYVIDTQTSFDATRQSAYVVFFVNDLPQYVVPMQDVSATDDGIQAIRAVLKTNGIE